MDQLWKAIMAVFNSWMGNKAVQYRRIERISSLKGTAVNVQAMVFGNTGGNSGTGVAFTRDPNSGEDEFFGDYLINAQGEDVVAGIRTPEPITQLDTGDAQGLQAADGHPQEARDSTTRRCRTSSSRSRTAPSTCSRPGPASGPARAAVRIAVEMVKEGLIDEKTAVKRVAPTASTTCFCLSSTPRPRSSSVAQGHRRQPRRRARQGDPLGRGGRRRTMRPTPTMPIMLVRKETSPEDVAGMHLAKGILTATGGKASHAAVVARGWGKPCVVGCEAIAIDEKNRPDHDRRHRSSRSATS